MTNTEALQEIAEAIRIHAEAITDQTEAIRGIANQFFTFVGFNNCSPPNTLDVCVHDFGKQIADALELISTSLGDISTKNGE